MLSSAGASVCTNSLVATTSDGELIEVQGTAEGRPFSRGDFDHVLALALEGIATLVTAQRAALR